MRVHLEQIVGKISASDWDLIDAIAQPLNVEANAYLLSEGQVCRHIWFLQTGAIRFYELSKGEEHTTHLFLPDTFFTLYHSLILREPSELYIIATEPCQLITLPYEQLSALYDQSHKIERIGRIMAEFQFVSEFNRRRMHLNMDALERYEHLEQHHPNILQRFQQKHIASYLGITPVSLSRLRNYRLKKK